MKSKGEISGDLIGLDMGTTLEMVQQFEKNITTQSALEWNRLLSNLTVYTSMERVLSLV